MRVSAAYEQVFGGVNNSFLRSESKRPMREGKTARDKAKGHEPYKKNRRVWDDEGRRGAGKWVKV